MARRWALSVLVGFSTAGAANAAPVFYVDPLYGPRGHVVLVATCKSYSNCEQAVCNWCEGRHSRADGDNDGIPCENVCRNRAQVREIQSRIGCNK